MDFATRLDNVHPWRDPGNGYVQGPTTGGEFFAVCCWCGMLNTPNRGCWEDARADYEQHAQRCPRKVR